jgi:hypothetical protein
MSYIFSNRFKTLSITVFLLGAVTAGFAYSVKLAQRPKPAIGFTITSRQTAALVDGTPAGSITEVRYQKSDGSWKQVRTYFGPDGKMLKEDIGFGQSGRGVFHVDKENKALQFLSQMEVQTVNKAAYDRHKDEKFVRDDTVLGYKTEVLRFTQDDGSGYTDKYFAPALQGLPIKSGTSQQSFINSKRESYMPAFTSNVMEKPFFSCRRKI